MPRLVGPVCNLSSWWIVVSVSKPLNKLPVLVAWPTHHLPLRAVAGLILRTVIYLEYHRRFSVPCAVVPDSTVGLAANSRILS